MREKGKEKERKREKERGKERQGKGGRGKEGRRTVIEKGHHCLTIHPLPTRQAANGM